MELMKHWNYRGRFQENNEGQWGRLKANKDINKGRASKFTKTVKLEVKNRVCSGLFITSNRIPQSMGMYVRICDFIFVITDFIQLQLLK